MNSEYLTIQARLEVMYFTQAKESTQIGVWWSHLTYTESGKKVLYQDISVPP